MDLECDVLIVGSGIGGLTAAITAKLSGLEPLVLEKQWEIGGTSALSRGRLWLPDNPLMQREGIPDSRAEALTYMGNFASDTDPGSSPARRKAFVENVDKLVLMYESQGIDMVRWHDYADHFDLLPGASTAGRTLSTPAFDATRLGTWLERFHKDALAGRPVASAAAGGREPDDVRPGGLMAVKAGLRAAFGRNPLRNRLVGGGALQARILEAALNLRSDIRNVAALTGLIEEHGRIVGARATIRGKDVAIGARSGVLVTAGGFARNPQMRSGYQPAPADDRWSHANPGETGEALQAMIDAGAALGWMEECWWVPVFADPDDPRGSRVLMAELHKPHMIVVGNDGERFANEAESSMAFGRACRARSQPTGAPPAWAIMDMNHRRRYDFAGTVAGEIPQQWLDNGMIRQAPTIAALAELCGIAPAALEATVRRWNGMCEAGIDLDFGKGLSAYNRYFGDAELRMSEAANPCMGPIAEGPFWAAPLQVGDVGTCGGAITDEAARVLRADGSAIPGLYAAGNCASPLCGPYAVGTGSSLSASAIFGMLAVRHMAI